MTGTNQSSLIRTAALLATISFALSGCLMGDEEPKEGDDIAADNELIGSVGDGPIIGASMRVLRNDGAELVQLESDFFSDLQYNCSHERKVLSVDD